MSTLELQVQPTGTETHHVAAFELEQARYVFTFYTNAVDGGWYLDIENDDASSVVRGIALAVGVNILFPYRHLDLPPGILQIEDKELDGSDPDLLAFAEGRAALWYTESSS